MKGFYKFIKGPVPLGTHTDKLCNVVDVPLSLNKGNKMTIEDTVKCNLIPINNGGTLSVISERFADI